MGQSSILALVTCPVADLSASAAAVSGSAEKRVGHFIIICLFLIIIITSTISISITSSSYHIIINISIIIIISSSSSSINISIVIFIIIVIIIISLLGPELIPTCGDRREDQRCCRRRENMVGVNTALAEFVKFKHGLYRSCGMNVHHARTMFTPTMFSCGRCCGVAETSVSCTKKKNPLSDWSSEGIL